jgi:phosphatidylserine decarboxylase
MAERELPLWARKPLLGFYCRLYNCNLDEIQFEESQFDPKLEPLTGYDVLKRYTCLQQFFTRHLKSHVRPISDTLVVRKALPQWLLLAKKALNNYVFIWNLSQVSPVDGKVLIVGEIKDGSRHIQQVKGVVYDINEFLGAEPKRQNRNTKLAHCIIYLAPGDYHGIHSPAHWDVKKRLHVPGLHHFCYPSRP